MGQGLHTKVLQAAAYALNEPLGGMENGVDFAKMRIVDQDSHVSIVFFVGDATW
jgi:hypothetical protein